MVCMTTSVHHTTNQTDHQTNCKNSSIYEIHNCLLVYTALIGSYMNYCCALRLVRPGFVNFYA